jgi:hypothetical protein
MAKQSEFDDSQLNLQAKTNAQLSAELQELELEEKQLDLEIKRETVAKIRSQRAAKLEEARSKLLATRQFLAQRKAVQDNCRHRKGGIGAEAVMRGEGTSAMYCVAKHKKPNGRWMVMCMRCGAEWHQGYELLNEAETPGFREAIQWPTDNSPSGSSTFLFEKVSV